MYKKGFSFQEVAIALVAASLFSGIAIVSYKWLYNDTEQKSLILKATEFEKTVRSLANSNLVAPNSINLSDIINELSDNNFQIEEKNEGVEIVLNNKKVCVVLGDSVNKKGEIYNESC